MLDADDGRHCIQQVGTQSHTSRLVMEMGGWIYYRRTGNFVDMGRTSIIRDAGYTKTETAYFNTPTMQHTARLRVYNQNFSSAPQNKMIVLGRTNFALFSFFSFSFLIDLELVPALDAQTSQILLVQQPTPTNATFGIHT